MMKCKQMEMSGSKRLAHFLDPKSVSYTSVVRPVVRQVVAVRLQKFVCIQKERYRVNSLRRNRHS
jgi:hypothetical protein